MKKMEINLKNDEDSIESDSNHNENEEDEINEEKTQVHKQSYKHQQCLYFLCRSNQKKKYKI